MLYFPYEVDTLLTRRPIANITIVCITVLVSLLAIFGKLSEADWMAMTLWHWSLPGLFGHTLLHAGWMHLIGNMLMLWIFGNAICGIMNQSGYALLYLSMGLLAGATHLVFDGGPAIGASGAVSGIMGVYLAVYPTNHVNVFWLWMFRTGTFEVSGWILIVIYFLLDLSGLLMGSGKIAYWAHIGGTVCGFCAGLLLLKLGVFDREDYDLPTALDYFSRRDRE